MKIILGDKNSEAPEFFSRIMRFFSVEFHVTEAADVHLLLGKRRPNLVYMVALERLGQLAAEFFGVLALRVGRFGQVCPD